MILIFDLDDTLYEELSFVLSGFRAVAEYGAKEFGLDAEVSFRMMEQTLEDEGRGRVFDLWLSAHGIHTGTNVARCIKVYRHHHPKIQMPRTHRKMLERLGENHPLYLVTDGHKIAQHRKVQALDIAPLFRRVFITHRFGIAQAKPSLHCFEIIRDAEKCDWSQLVYVGDNPAKDFVNLNKVGAVTVRVRTGAHAMVDAKPGYDATHQLDSLVQFETLLPEL